MLNPYDYGAVGDGLHDDTAAFQAVINRAGETGESIRVDCGKYLVGELTMRPQVHITADATWGFRNSRPGNTILIQKDENQSCILDMTEANACTIDGLSLMGTGSGGCVGILSKKTDYGSEEDAYRLENCRVSHFGSHAVFLDHIWCFSVRHCMFAHSGGDGLRINGWDGFVIDNWFSGNRGAGFGVEGPNASVTMTGNRIEWNGAGGIRLEGGSHYNITGNYIDRSGSAGIIMRGTSIAAVTGNIIYRSGKNEADDPESSNVILERCSGVTFTGNSINVGSDDGGKGDMTPNYAMRLSELRDCVVAQNVMYRGGMRRLIHDLGHHINSII
ncbi:MAG: right-handed parallel beta-helix repeat-containing protein, partial [Eubacteriales bacterium]